MQVVYASFWRPSDSTCRIYRAYYFCGRQMVFCIWYLHIWHLPVSVLLLFHSVMWTDQWSAAEVCWTWNLIQISPSQDLRSKHNAWAWCILIQSHPYHYIRWNLCRKLCHLLVNLCASVGFWKVTCWYIQRFGELGFITSPAQNNVTYVECLENKGCFICKVWSSKSRMYVFLHQCPQICQARRIHEII